MRVCNRCKKEKEEIEFNARKDKRQPWCRDCTTDYSKKWYMANRQSHIAYVREHDKRERKPHLCRFCKRGEPEVIFYIKKTGERYYRRFICLDCDKDYRKKYPTSEAAKKREDNRKSARQKISRATPSDRHKHIYSSSRRSDKLKSRENDLDKEFIRELVVNGCCYCGDAESQMTLDRVDNAIGHLKSNVVPACIRCNYFRRDMPYEAWLLMVPAMKEARILGLLDGWHPGVNKNRTMKICPASVQQVERV